jgi:hypothetical protein
MVEQNGNIVRILVNPSEDVLKQLQEQGFVLVPFDKERARQAFVKDQEFATFFHAPIKAEPIKEEEPFPFEVVEPGPTFTDEAKFALLADEMEHLYKHALKNKLRVRKLLHKKHPKCSCKEEVSKVELDTAFSLDLLEKEMSDLKEKIKNLPKPEPVQVPNPIIVHKADNSAVEALEHKMTVMKHELDLFKEEIKSHNKKLYIALVLIGLLAVFT